MPAKYLHATCDVHRQGLQRLNYKYDFVYKMYFPINDNNQITSFLLNLMQLQFRDKEKYKIKVVQMKNPGKNTHAKLLMC